MKTHCKACGGYLKPEDERCGLCGTPAGVDPDELEMVELSEDEEVPASPSTPALPGDGVFCNACGWKNPVGSRFCSKCGGRVQDLSAKGGPGASPRPVSRPPKAAAAPRESEGVGRQVGIIVGAAVMVVLALYLISALGSNTGGPQPPIPIDDQAPAALPAGVAQRAAALDDSVAAATGDRRLGFMRRRVELYISANRYDLAGAAQEEIATETGLEVDWAFAGNLYYDTMDREPEGTERRATFAKKAIASYREVLAANPDNLDVRTDMAVAYLSDPDNPMLAIQETQAVLERDSLHVQANFNRGIMLLQIGRVDQATEQFRKVQRIVGNPADDIHRRAQMAIDQITGSAR